MSENENSEEINRYLSIINDLPEEEQKEAWDYFLVIPRRPEEEQKKIKWFLEGIRRLSPEVQKIIMWFLSEMDNISNEELWWQSQEINHLPKEEQELLRDFLEGIRQFSSEVLKNITYMRDFSEEVQKQLKELILEMLQRPKEEQDKIWDYLIQIKQPPKESKKEIEDYLSIINDLPEEEQAKIKQVADYMKNHLDPIYEKCIKMTDEELAEIIAPDWDKLIREGEITFCYKEIADLLCGNNPDMPDICDCLVNKLAADVSEKSIEQEAEGINRKVICAGIKKYIISAKLSLQFFNDFLAMQDPEFTSAFDRALKYLIKRCLIQSLPKGTLISNKACNLVRKKLELRPKISEAILNDSNNCFGEETTNLTIVRMFFYNRSIQDNCPLKIIEVIGAFKDEVRQGILFRNIFWSTRWEKVTNI